MRKSRILFLSLLLIYFLLPLSSELKAGSPKLELSEKDIVSEVKESFYNYKRALIQLRSVYKRLAYRKKLVELAKHRSEINEIQISEYIQAEIDLINEQNNLYNAMVDFFLAKTSLNKAIGIKDYSPIQIVSSSQK